MDTAKENPDIRTNRALNRLAKWRSVFAGWQLGTRPDTDGETLAVRDHREVTLMLRVEVNALTTLLVEKGVFTLDEFTKVLGDEAVALDAAFEQKFPGMRSTDVGISMDAVKALETMRRMGFPD